MSGVRPFGALFFGHLGDLNPAMILGCLAGVEAAMDRLLDKTYRTASNERLAKHLRQQREYLFTFLHCPGLEGTNCRAERAIRPAVIARKVWGGNRTWNGANVQQILMSVLRTFHQQGKDAFASLVELLRIPGHKILEIVPTRA